MITERERILNTLSCTNMRMRRATRAMNDFYNNALEPSGLHANQLMLLIPPYLKPGLTINEFAQVVALDRTTLTRNLKLLEERQLIMLRPGEDQRTREVHITERGRQTLLDALPLWEKAQQQIVDLLGEAHLTQLFGYLDKLEELPNNNRSE